MVVSLPLMLEYEAVLKRPEMLQAFGLDMQEVENLLDTVAALGEPTRIDFLWRPRLTDPGDEMVLEAAVNGRADLLVTFNTKDFAGAERFACRVVDPGTALASIRSEIE